VEGWRAAALTVSLMKSRSRWLMNERSDLCNGLHLWLYWPKIYMGYRVLVAQQLTPGP